MMSTDITPATKFLCLYIIRSSEEFAVDGNDWQGAFALSDGLCEEFDFQRWRDALIQDVVNGIKDGHIDAIALIDMAHATHTVVAFCDHLHFHLGVFHAITATDHLTKHTIAREVGITGHQQVAEIGTIVDISLDRIDCAQETMHFLHSTRQEH